MDNNKLWQAVLAELELSVSNAQFVTWFNDTSILSNENGKVVIAVPNGFAQEWLENKFNKQIINSLRNFQDDVKEIKCVIHASGKNKTQKAKGIDMIKSPQSQQKIDLSSPETIKKPAFKAQNNLNKRYTFENFIVGENNELAKAACYAVSRDLGNTYNPLFIYGGVGLGKTHLLQAIGNEVLKNNLNKIIRYISSENFTSDLINSIKNGTIDKFKEEYKRFDLLIIDDIQFISGKEKTQTEFFHIFNTLYQVNKQIVLSSDRPPKEIQILEDRLRSRFEGGMIADIGNPDFETRIAILRAKSAEKDFFLDEEIIEFIAKNFKNNVRELEGALNKLIAACSLTNTTPDLNYTQKTLADSLLNIKKSKPGHKDIIKKVADFYEINEEDLIKKGRKKKIALPRQIAMFLIRIELDLSFPEIGDCFGGRDHTTALHAFNKIRREIDKNEKIKIDVENIKKLLA